MQYPCGWVSPFGHRRIKAYCQLPDAFRRLSRPSSPLTAKASTMCAYSLDHITPSCLRMTRIPANGTTYHYFNKAARAARLSLTTRCRHSSQTLATSRFSKNMPQPQRQGISKCVCAVIQRYIVVGLGGLEPPASPLSGARSNHLSYRPNVSRLVVEPVGIEPTTPCLQSRCSPS